MSNAPQQPKVSQRKQVRSALERIDNLEGDMQRVFEAVNRSSMTNQNRTQDLANILEACVELLGSSSVDGKMKEISERKTLDALLRAQEALKTGLETGDLVKADTISDLSLVVGREIDSKGEINFPGRVQLQMSGIKPEFQEQLRGKGAGTVLETPNGGKFEVLEVYDVVVKAPEAPQKETEPASTQTVTDTVEQLEAALKPAEA